MGNKPNTTELEPDKRVWEYDGDGTKIYKLDQGYDKRLFTPKNTIGVLIGGGAEGFRIWG